MSLTVAAAPFGRRPAGRFNFDPPGHVVYVEPLLRRVRALRDGRTVVDSDRVLLVHETGLLARYAFPSEDVSLPAEPDPFAAGHVRVPWDAADAWFEEDEEVFVHPRDPYHRIDTLPTSRLIEVSVDGVALARSARALALYETGLPIRYYLPAEDVRTQVLAASDTITHCAYKGTPRHWSARTAAGVVPDVAWSYGDGDLLRDAEPVRGRIAFYNERTDLDIDGVRQERPQSPWSR